MPKEYKEDQLQRTLDDVRHSRLSKKKAAEIYNIPRATIQLRLGSKFKKTKPGPPTILTPDEEAELIVWIKESQRKGFPKRKGDLIYAKNF